MKALVVVGHPAHESLNNSIARTIRDAWEVAGCDVSFHDLLQENFNPLLTASEARGEDSNDPLVQVHISDLRSCDLLAVVHPNCWGAPPAIMKGWIDRVFAENAAFTFAKGDGQEGRPIGLLKAKAALIFNTGNTPLEREAAVFGDPLERMWRDCILRFCGVSHVTRRLFGVVETSTLDQRQDWLSEVAVLAREAVAQSSSH